MFRFVARRLGISPYTLFMMEQKANSKLAGLKVSERGKMTSKMYKELSPSEKAELMKRAATHPTPKRAPYKTKAQKKPREPSAYARFVQENIHKFDKLPRGDRMRAVAKLWKSQHPSPKIQ